QEQAVYDALYERFFTVDGVTAWQSWPPEYRQFKSEAVQRFAREHRDSVDFYLYLQWLGDEQLAAVQAAARQAGMGIGLYRDLAVGADPGGAEVWGQRDWYSEASIGAPPDPL